MFIKKYFKCSIIKSFPSSTHNFLRILLLIIFSNASANFSFQLFFLPKPSRYLVPIIGLTIKLFATFSPNVLLSLEDN